MNLINYIKQLNKEMFEGTKEASEPTELQMHKILFIAYGFFYKNFKKELFEANFEAWKYGPVEIDYRDSINKNKNNLDKFNVNLNTIQKEYLSKLLNKLLKCSTWFLVDYTHDILAWKEVWNNESKNKKISNEKIKASFENLSSWI